MNKTFHGILILLAFSFSASIFAHPVTGAGATTGKFVRTCTGSQLSVSVDKDFQGDSAMGGQRGDQLIVKNISRSRCTISGTAGVTLFDRSGRKMGRSVKPRSGTVTTLKPGGKATFEIGYHSCEYAAESSGKKKARCKMSRTAEIRFAGIARVFTVRERLDAVNGIEQAMDLEPVP